MKSFKQFKEGLDHISNPLKKIKDDLIKKRPRGDEPYTQEPGGPPKKV
tara:strand:+ start:597 stop:740 length:144 start_codon:yes stop_codon:yes gene_type:complete